MPRKSHILFYSVKKNCNVKKYFKTTIDLQFKLGNLKYKNFIIKIYVLHYKL